jgi:hypothetical protein
MKPTSAYKINRLDKAEKSRRVKDNIWFCPITAPKKYKDSRIQDGAARCSNSIETSKEVPHKAVHEKETSITRQRLSAKPLPFRHHGVPAKVEGGSGKPIRGRKCADQLAFSGRRRLLLGSPTRKIAVLHDNIPSPSPRAALPYQRKT